MPPGLGAGLVQIVERRARKLELAGRLQADRAIGAGKRDHIAAFHHRPPAEAGQAHQQIANAARLVIARRAVVAHAVDELLVLGADTPAFGRLLALGESRNQLVAVLDDR